MKRCLRLLGCLTLLSFLCVSFSAASFAEHYTNGVEGIRAATLPPPGWYYRMYNLYYHANDFADFDGTKTAATYRYYSYAMIHRVYWVSNFKLLGGNYAADLAVPIVYKKYQFGAINDSSLGLGDVLLEPFLISWHGSRWDAAAGVGVFFPTGKYNENKAVNPGYDYWTGEVGAGGTYYFDAAKTWSASILARYEKNTEEDLRDITRGDDFHFEWGLGKIIPGRFIWEVGAAGYCQWQITNDTGSAVTYDPDVHDRVFASGPEVNLTIPEWKVTVTLRHLWEYAAEDRPQGTISLLNITKAF